jgi:hypothetical protein
MGELRVVGLMPTKMLKVFNLDFLSGLDQTENSEILNTTQLFP